MTQNKKEGPAVVVLNMHYTGIGIARSLYKLGVTIIGLGIDKNCFGAHSKFCKFLVAPDSHKNPSDLLKFLINLAISLDEKPILLPTRDYDVLFIGQHYEKLTQHFLAPQASPEIINNIVDKDKLYNAVQINGISCPAQHKITSHSDLVKHQNEIIFPCVAKPLSSHAWRNKNLKSIVGNQKAIEFENYEKLDNFYATIKDDEPQLLVQEQIVGPESNLYIFGAYVSQDQSSIYYYTARKLLQYPLNFGTGIIVESYHNPEIIEPSKQLIQTLKYSGLCEIEYKYDKKRKKYYLIEINTRHWDQHLLGLAFGMNLTELLYLDLTKGQLKSPDSFPYKEIKTRWIADQDFPFAATKLLLSKQIPIKVLLTLISGKKIYGSVDFRDLRLSYFSIKTSIVAITTMVLGKLRKTVTSG